MVERLNRQLPIASKTFLSLSCMSSTIGTLFKMPAGKNRNMPNECLKQSFTTRKWSPRQFQALVIETHLLF